MTGAAYRRSETGWVMVIAMAGAFLVSAAVAAAGWLAAGALYALAFPALFLIVGINFYRLETSVDDAEVRVRLGAGLIVRRVPLAGIKSAELVREAWYGGWGLRWTGNGWFWTVGSLDAVALNLKSGREFLIGTDEPQALLDAVNARLGAKK